MKGKQKTKRSDSIYQIILSNLWVYLLFSAIGGYIFSASFFEEFNIEYFYHAGIWDYAKLLVLYVEKLWLFILINIFFILVTLGIISKINKNNIRISLESNWVILLIIFAFINYIVLKLINTNQANYIKNGENGVYSVSYNSKKEIACASIIGSTNTEYFFYDLNKMSTIIIPKSNVKLIKNKLKARPTLNHILNKQAVRPPPPPNNKESKYWEQHKTRYLKKLDEPREQWLVNYKDVCGIEHPEFEKYKDILSD